MSSLPLASVVLGVATHISSLKLQLDDYGWRLLGLWNLTLTLLFLWLSRSYDFLAATRLVFTFAATFLFGFFGSTTVYRFFFSPLRKFRGPWQGVFTSFYRLHAAITTDVRLFRSIDSLHKQYGDYVRIGAREISILNPSAIPLLYGAKAQCKRGTWYHHSPEAEEDRQVLLIADPAIHSWRRRILDRGFSSKGKWPPHLAIRSRLRGDFAQFSRNEKLHTLCQNGPWVGRRTAKVNPILELYLTSIQLSPTMSPASRR